MTRTDAQTAHQAMNLRWAAECGLALLVAGASEAGNDEAGQTIVKFGALPAMTFDTMRAGQPCLG
jgi:hypothetical protein